MKQLISAFLLIGSMGLLLTACDTTTPPRATFESTHDGLTPQQYHDAYHGRIDQPTDGEYGVE